VLGRYSLHYHLVGDTMRGSSVIGASIWNSDNRWLTVHGTNHLIVRDCVGYNSIGHGFFLEDGTEIDNVFDRNLAVQAALGKQLPKQVLPFDFNDGAGFWWANCLNTFTRNVAAECDQHGFRFEAAPEHGFSPVLPIRQPSGEFKNTDIRTLPFVKFENNEVHSQRRFGLNLGGIRGVATYDELVADSEIQSQKVRAGHVQGVGPDTEHPFVIKGFKAWTTHWVFHGGSPSVLMDGLDAFDCNYGIWRSRMDMHEYSNLSMRQMKQKHFYHPWGGTSEVNDSYEQNLKVTDDRPPTTVITHITRASDGKVKVHGTVADASPIRHVMVNGQPASVDEHGQWEVLLDAKSGSGVIEAAAEDVHGNKEALPHQKRLTDDERL